MCECNHTDHNEESKFPIQTVANNKEKYVTYQVYMQRFKKAKESEFYLECLWILYAMIEDRTSAFLYHIGFTAEQKRSAVTGSNKIKKDIREIFGLEDNKNIKYKFDTLRGKLNRIEELLKWCEVEHETLSNFQKNLVEIMLPIAESSEFRDTLNYLELEWRDKRNQLIHTLFNKNSAAVTAELCQLVEEGYIAVRKLDDAVKKVKKYPIRSKFKIQ